MNNQYINQVNATVNKQYSYKITGEPKTFQLDVMFYKRASTLTPILLFVDILSRKLWTFVLSKNTANEILECIQQLNKEVGNIHGLTGDNQFSTKLINEYCEKHNIRLDTSVAKREHISGGDKLGIVDRICRTLRELINRYYEITGHKTDNFKNVIKAVVEMYNENEHSSIKTTPNKAWNDNNIQVAKHLSDSIHNQQVYKQYLLRKVNK